MTATPTEKEALAALTELSGMVLDAMKVQPMKKPDMSKFTTDDILDSTGFHLTQKGATAISDAIKGLKEAKRELELPYALISKIEGNSQETKNGKLGMVTAVDQALTDAINALVEVDRTMVADIAAI